MTTTYASFEYPKLLGDLPNKPLAKRLEDFKKDKPQGLRLSGYRQSSPCPNTDGRMFYLDSDFMPSLRWEWADKVEYSRIDHKGWYDNEFGDGDTIRGIVFRLPHGKGFLAGWSMGKDMIGELDYGIIDCEVDAARRADRMAERVAEVNRNYTYDRTCHDCYDYMEDTPLTEVNHKGELICKDCLDKLDNGD